MRHFRKTTGLIIVLLATMLLGMNVQASLRLSKKKLTVVCGKTAVIELKGVSAGVSWKSSKPKVARIRAIGNRAQITGKKAGNAKITAKVGKKKFVCTVTVREKPVLSMKSVKIGVGGKICLKVNGTGSKVRWSVSDKNIAAIKKTNAVSCEVRVKKKGLTTVKARVGKKTLKCKVEVLKAGSVIKVTDVLVNIGNNTIIVGQTVRATATITPSNATSKKVIWTSSDSSVATVNASGVVKGVMQGTATIKAEAADGSGEYDYVRISVLDDVLAPYRKGLAAARKQGPAAVIKYCEQNRKKIDIGKYGNRGIGWDTVDSETLNAEADYGAALEALYKPWRNQVFARSLAQHTGDPFEQAYLLTAYINGMYFYKMVYVNRTVGWGLCPAVAPLLAEGMQTNIQGSGCATQQSYLGGNCTSVANLLIDILRDKGINGELRNTDDDSFHVGARVKFTSGSHKGVYVFDPMKYRVFIEKSDGSLKRIRDYSISALLDRLEATYGAINYNP